MKSFHIAALLIVIAFTVTYSQPRGASIQSIDFENFTYPYTSGLLLPTDRQRHFRLHNGTFPETKRAVGMYFGHVFYGDVTGDGIEEALVFLVVHTNGSAIPGCVYVYQMGRGRPQLLWSFDTGDRADGGFRQIYSDRGQLVLELYGRGKILGRDLFADDGTRAETPYPYLITRTRYVWRRNRFRRVGKPEQFSDSRGYGSPLFYSSSQSNKSLDASGGSVFLN
jgi:hypothetical protein